MKCYLIQKINYDDIENIKIVLEKDKNEIKNICDEYITDNYFYNLECYVKKDNDNITYVYDVGSTTNIYLCVSEVDLYVK